MVELEKRNTIKNSEIVAKGRVPKYLEKESVDEWDISKGIIVLAIMR